MKIKPILIPILLSCVTCAPYMPPVPANPFGDKNTVRVEAMPVNESNPNGPLQMVLRKHIKGGWITLGDLCQAVSDGAIATCPTNRAAHITYVTPGEYKVRAEYIGPTGKTLWGSVIETFEAGYVYTCEVTDVSNAEGCQRAPLAEAAAAPPPTLAPSPGAAPPSSTPPTVPPTPAPGLSVCQKDVDCAGDLICSSGTCVSPTPTVSAPPPVEIVPEPAVTIVPPQPSACDACPGKCESHKLACNAGTVSSCFELGACLCECKMDAGGCGDSMTALTECIAKNRAKANPKPVPAP